MESLPHSWDRPGKDHLQAAGLGASLWHRTAHSIYSPPYTLQQSQVQPAVMEQIICLQRNHLENRATTLLLPPQRKFSCTCLCARRRSMFFIYSFIVNNGACCHLKSILEASFQQRKNTKCYKLQKY